MSVELNACVFVIGQVCVCVCKSCAAPEFLITVLAEGP